MNFRKWMERNFDLDTLKDITEHGADCGYNGITYTSDCVKLYEKFEFEIWDALNDDAEAMGHENPIELISTFRRKDMLTDPNQFKTLLVWYMVEKHAAELCVGLKKNNTR